MDWLKGLASAPELSFGVHGEARTACGFADLVAHDPFPVRDGSCADSVTSTSLDELMTESDVLSLHLPLTPQSRYLLNATTIPTMKRSACLGNTSFEKRSGRVLQDDQLARLAAGTAQAEGDLL